ncbi:hypothetical protein A1OE_1076 [Candidatus Endolissoclinum faulkneri L2]|uniref:Uncharacterized protein n=1 Tax=Candidatus Endolissoclinum faulkneri L2 TaxID=1193729 RepID=K7YRT0_9PROT|nr:hypothetical protein A1OE_1076 [Candidatus Endolissoclinum faulkneri L2]
MKINSISLIKNDYNALIFIVIVNTDIINFSPSFVFNYT